LSWAGLDIEQATDALVPYVAAVLADSKRWPN
jgi:hypothetical protein